MEQIKKLDAMLTSCSVDRILMIWVELGPEDDERLRCAISETAGLEYGAYENVAFETAIGRQFFKGREGAITGVAKDVTEVPARVLTFSIPYDLRLLSATLETIQTVHSYQEPVTYIFDGFATRTKQTSQDTNPNRWWNRKPGPVGPNK